MQNEKAFKKIFQDILKVEIFVLGKKIEEINYFIENILKYCKEIPEIYIKKSEKYKNKKSSRLRLNHKDILLIFEGLTKSNIDNNKREEIKNCNFVILFLNLLEHEQFDEIIEYWFPFLLNEINFKNNILICGLDKYLKELNNQEQFVQINNDDKNELIEVDEKEINLLLNIFNNSLISYELIDIENSIDILSKICKPIKVTKLKKFFSDDKNCYIF
jgi:hypothetical protein